MPRGRKKVDIIDEEIIDTNKEEGTIPFFLIDNEYGISGNFKDYTLVQKRKGNRLAKVEDGEEFQGKYISYINWSPIGYYGNLTGVFQGYLKYCGLAKSKKLQKSNDYHDLLNIYSDIYNHINESLKYEALPSKIVKLCNIAESIGKLQEQIDMLQARYNDLLSKSNELENFIREKRSMIIKEMEPKKHRIKLEKN